MIGQEIDVLRIASRVGRSVVLKPVVGSGSELTFKCNSPLEVLAAYKQVKRGLTANVEVGPLAQRAKSPADCVVVIEEYIDGREYSCDFALEDNRAEIIRVARKIFAPYLPFGATLGYIVPAELPRGISQTELGRQMLQAAQALGLERALCMVDFVMRDGRPVFLELSPRPGGDCLPPLIKRSCGLDMLGLALDFAEGSPLHIPEAKAWRRLVGCRLFAAHGGKISKLDCARLVDDPRVIECRLRFSVGHEVKLPPQDYTSWLLGHVIFSSPAHHHVEQECREISAKLIVETGLYHDEKFPEIHSQTHRPSQASGTAA